MNDIKAIQEALEEAARRQWCDEKGTAAEDDSVLKSVDSALAALDRVCDEKALLLSAVQMSYQKHQLGLCDIGWEQLGDKLQNTLCEIMGDDAYNAWVCSMEGMDRSPI